MKSALGRIVGALKLPHKPLTYEEEKEIARNADVSVRAKLAAREDVRPEILYYLAEDPSPEVRRNIAANAQTPRHADLVLARDDDDDVRCDLVSKIARLAPGLSANEQEQVKRLTYQVLEVLARDQLVRVRRILAETIKDMTDAPAAIIGRLARDTEVEVAGPVLRSSPVLTDEDLLEIIRTCRAGGLLNAISQRANVAARVSDAIVATDDVQAIGSLLSNPSAQIREETLDRLIDRAPDIEAWHAPLVRRPKLSPWAVTRIAAFVADHLIEALQARGDIDSGTVETLKGALHNRLEREAAQPRNKGEAADKAGPPAHEDADALYERLRREHAQGRLTGEDVSTALGAGDRRFVVAALSVLSGLPLALVEKISESRSARGITALCWKAGLGMLLATKVQIRFAHIAPNAAVMPTGADKYPMTPEEMQWQIDFFATMIPGGAGPKAGARA